MAGKLQELDRNIKTIVAHQMDCRNGLKCIESAAIIRRLLQRLPSKLGPLQISSARQYGTWI